MEMKRNIGIMNSLIRITLGLTILSWCTAKLTRRPWRQSYLFMAMLGAMKVAEGILQYCPMTDAVKCKLDEINKVPLKKMIDAVVPNEALTFTDEKNHPPEQDSGTPAVDSPPEH